jgi:hypothetical protein
MRRSLLIAATLLLASHGDAADAPGRFTDALVDEVRETWDSVVKHKFTDQLAAGTLDLSILKCYLIQDHRFIDAFVVLLSSMIAHARKLEDRIPGAQFLGLITGKENTYFERSFEALGVTKREREETPDAPAMSGFQGVMRDAAKSGSLGEVRSERNPTDPRLRLRALPQARARTHLMTLRSFLRARADARRAGRRRVVVPELGRARAPRERRGALLLSRVGRPAQRRVFRLGRRVPALAARRRGPQDDGRGSGASPRALQGGR